MKIWWCQEHEASGYTGREVRWCHPGVDLGEESHCRMVPMRLIPNNAELSAMLKQVRGEEVEYQPGYFVWQMEKVIRDAILAALDGETP